MSVSDSVCASFSIYIYLHIILTVEAILWHSVLNRIETQTNTFFNLCEYMCPFSVSSLVANSLLVLNVAAALTLWLCPHSLHESCTHYTRKRENQITYKYMHIERFFQHSKIGPHFAIFILCLFPIDAIFEFENVFVCQS